MSRPRLKRRRITRHSSKIAIMQPIQHLFFLRYPRKPQTRLISLPRSMSQCQFSILLVTLTIIYFLPATSNEKHIADFDVATLRCRPDVDALVFTAVVQLVPGDFVVVVWIVADSLFVCVAPVVEEYAATGDPVFGQVVD